MAFIFFGLDKKFKVCYNIYRKLKSAFETKISLVNGVSKNGCLRAKNKNPLKILLVLVLNGLKLVLR